MGYKEENKMKLSVIFGSTSDEEKVLPGIVRVTKEIPGLEVLVHYASADNTPQKVQEIGGELAFRDVMTERTNAYISGAGMSNVLTGVLKSYASLKDVVIGIPISDSVTEGVSSMLSTSEKPPLNPVLTVGLNNSYAALNIGYRFMQQKFEGIKIFGEDRAVEKLKEECNNLGLKNYTVRAPLNEVVQPNEVIITALPSLPSRSDAILSIDRELRKGCGVQIFCSSDKPTDFAAYAKCLDGTEATGLVSAIGYKNAVMMAAQLTQDKDALRAIDMMKQKKANELNNHTGFYVINGEKKMRFSPPYGKGVNDT